MMNDDDDKAAFLRRHEPIDMSKAVLLTGLSLEELRRELWGDDDE